MAKVLTVDEKYQLLSEREKIIKRPSRYVGAVEACTKMQWIIDAGKMTRDETVWNPAFIKMVDEVVSNSTDHSKTPEGKHMTYVKVAYDTTTGQISVEDDGGIPIVKHKEHKIYIPELIFGNMHSGSNFDDSVESTGAGQNGEGSTLVNIFSKEFIVESADGKKSFKQIFTDNMSNKTKPLIEKSTRKFTKISWICDKPSLKSGLTDNQNIQKLIKRIYDAAACNQHLKFYINGELLSFKNGFQDYIKMFSPDAICYSEKNWDVGFAPTITGDLEHISFVNGTASPVGGTHIDYVMDQVVNQVRDHVKKKTKQDVLPAQIKNHFMVFINATIINPRYDSQTKENLVTNVSDYGTKLTIPVKIANAIIKSPIMDSIMKWAEARAIAEENRAVAIEQKKSAKRNVEKHIEAAGDIDGDKILHLTEGDSAIGNFVQCRDPEIHGGYPLRGKVININGMRYSKILQNPEAADIMSITGLSLGEPVLSENLKYGKFCIMTDADTDGDCICGQLINFFSLWPEVFRQRRVVRLRTPMLIFHVDKKRENDIWFYNRKSYNEWIKANYQPNPKHVDHIKGLGELEEEDYERCLKFPVYQTYTLDKTDMGALELAFGDDAEPRKPWLIGE